MSGKARARNVRDENPGASVAQSPHGTRKKNTPKNEDLVEDTKTTNAKASGISKLRESKEVCARKPSGDADCSVQTPKPTESGEKKAAARSSARKEKSIEEYPSKDPQSETVTKKQRSDSGKTSDAPPKLQASQDVRPKKFPKDPDTIEKTQDNLTKSLQTVLQKLTVKKNERSESAKCVNEIESKITAYLKRHLDWCKNISVLRSGSYYENLKICQPDEFDIMLTIGVERVNLQPFKDDGAFYSVDMKRHSQTHPLMRFVTEDRTQLMASEMLREFREKIKEAVITLKSDKVTLERKKVGCPAVTLVVNENSSTISIDFVLSLEVRSNWPNFTHDGFTIENWLGKKVRLAQRRSPFYLVPKYEGRGKTEQDGVMAKDAWRISFSHVEKYILKNHGNSKTCCEKGQKCCRKQCLKLLKYLLQQLKEKQLDEADKLCSYHAKTTLLHACAARVKDEDWAESQLSHCFLQLLMDFEQNLRACELPNFFIPSQNLFNGLNKRKCNLLADYIESERNDGFPILK